MRVGGGAWVSALADAGDRLVGLAAGCLFSVLLVFSGYCLWDSATVVSGARVTPQLLKAAFGIGLLMFCCYVCATLGIKYTTAARTAFFSTGLPLGTTSTRLDGISICFRIVSPSL